MLEPAGERDNGRDPESSGQLGAGQLEQRQRVPARLGKDLLLHALVDRHVQRRRQQRSRVGIRKPLDRQHGEPGARLVIVACTDRDDDADRLRHQAPGREAQRLRRLPIEPLAIVHHAQQRLVRGRLGQKTEYCEPDEQAIRRRPGLQPERNGERIALRLRQRVAPIQQARAQLMQRSERQFLLCLDP
jgi:hypothetical protein